MIRDVLNAAEATKDLRNKRREQLHALYTSADVGLAG